MKSFHGLLLFLTSAFSAGLSSAQPVAKPPTYELQTIHQFPNFTWIENMAIRPNGQILATNAGGGNIFLVDPDDTSPARPPVIASFGKGAALVGITEVQDDVFYTVGSFNSNVYNLTFGANTTTVWKVDMRQYSASGNATVEKTVQMPELIVADGVTTLSKKLGIILVGDAGAGVVYKLNVKTKEYSKIFDDALLKPIPTAIPALGVNGIRIAGSDLYFSNTNQGLLGKVPVNLTTGIPTGVPTVISNQTPAADDFAIDPRDGSIWLAENVVNTLVHVFLNGTVEAIAGGANSTQLLGPVAASFGRGRFDKQVLYVSTDGLLFDAKGNALATNGKIAALDTGALGAGCSF